MARRIEHERTATKASPGLASLAGHIRLGTRLGLLSVASFALNYGLFAVFTRGLRWPAEGAAALAMAVAMALNFVACRYYVFESQQGSWSSQALRFAGGTVIFRAAELTSFSLAVRLTGSDGMVAYPSTLLVFFLIKMLVYRRFVFTSGPRLG